MDVKSVAVIGAGAAGAVTAAALKAENYFDRIRVFERRETPGGVWIYDPDPGHVRPIYPGKLPTAIDPPLSIPSNLPQTTDANQQERWVQTPIYNSLTTNVPDIAMCFSDSQFPYGPFVPHYVARQYIENYFAAHKTDTDLELNTTLEDLSWIPQAENAGRGTWKLTVRKYDPVRHVDLWREEIFDAVILANGHYSVPYVPPVKGLENFTQKFPGRVTHSKYYRHPLIYRSQRVIVIGNSASGHDVSQDLVSIAKGPVYVSRRSRSRWDGEKPPPGLEWKPTIKEFLSDGRIVFEDDTYLDDVDAVIYCTGYKASFPFWNEKVNKLALWDHQTGRLQGSYWHTFFHNFPTLGVVGIPRTVTFRSFEYQAVALARLWSKRNAVPLPSVDEQRAWETQRVNRTREEHTSFHDIPWENGETLDYLEGLFQIAGLGTLKGDGRIPPPFSNDMIWAIENIKKYPDHAEQHESKKELLIEDDESWVILQNKQKDLLAFI